MTLSRDDLHEALRQRLPGELLPWCKGCESHHARRGLLVMAGLHGRLCIAGRAGREPAFARTDQLVGWEPPEDAGASSSRRYHAQYGARRRALRRVGGIGKAHARSLWFDSDDAGERLDGVRVIAPGDPLLLTRDREALIADPAWRKRVWSAIPNTGVVLDHHEPVALWKARKQGKRLEVTLSRRGGRPRPSNRSPRTGLHEREGRRLTGYARGVRRVAIIASASGNGKTTLGRAIAARLRVRFVELDALVHGPSWAETPDDELKAILTPILAEDGWVIDGNTRRSSAHWCWMRRTRSSGSTCRRGSGSCGSSAAPGAASSAARRSGTATRRRGATPCGAATRCSATR